MVRARKSRQAAKKKTAEVEAAFQLDEISGSDVSIHSSEEDSYVSDDYEDDDDIDVDDDDDDDDDVEMVRIILLYYGIIGMKFLKSSISHLTTSFKGSGRGRSCKNDSKCQKSKKGHQGGQERHREEKQSRQEKTAGDKKEKFTFQESQRREY